MASNRKAPTPMIYRTINFLEANMLSDNAMKLALLLRQEIGPDKVGLGVEPARLVELWGDAEPIALLPAINELQRSGFVRMDTGIPLGRPSNFPAQWGLRDVVSVTVLEPLQEYCDDLGA